MPVTFSSNTTYAGISPAYQWKVNGANVGVSAPTYTYAPVNGDSVQCQLTSSIACLTTSPVVISNTIHMRVDTFIVPVVALTGDSIAGAGATVHLTASIMGTAGLYTIHWKNHGIEFTTTTVPSVTYTKAAGNDTVTATLVSMGRGCYDSVASSARLVYDHNVSVGSLHLAFMSPRVYPNPVDNVLHVEAVSEIHELIITNVLGQTVVNSGQQNGAVSMALDVSGLSSGVYFVKVNGVCTNRFVKR